MKKRILSILAVLLLVGVIFVAGIIINKKPTSNSSVDTKQTNVVIGEGSKNVPKTETEIIGDDKTTEYKTLDEVVKAFGTEFDVPTINGYSDVKYIITDDNVAGVIYYNNDGNSVSVKKGKNGNPSGDSETYQFIYTKTVNGCTVSVNSRLDEEHVGLAVWKNGDFSYSLQTTPWEEISWIDAEKIISDVK